MTTLLNRKQEAQSHDENYAAAARVFDLPMVKAAPEKKAPITLLPKEEAVCDGATD